MPRSETSLAEGVLLAERDRLAVGLDLAHVLAAREPRRVRGPSPRAPRASVSRPAARQVADRAEARRARAAPPSPGPTPQSRPTGSGSRNARTSPASTSSRPSGLARSLAIFATIFTGAMPDRDREAGLGAHLAPQPLAHFARRPEQPLAPGEVEEGLVEREAFHGRREALEDREDALRLARVLRHVAGHEDAVRAEPARLARSASPSGRRRRARLVARRRDDAAVRRCRRRSRVARAAQGDRAARSTRRTRPCRRAGSRAARGCRLSFAPHEQPPPRDPAGRRALGSLRPLRRAGRRAIEADLDAAEAAATRFAERHRGRVATLDAAALAAALDELEALQEPPARAGAYAGLLFAADTAASAPRRAAPARAGARQRRSATSSSSSSSSGWRSTTTARRAPARRPGARAPPPPARSRCAATGRTCCSEPEEQLLEETREHRERACGRLFDEILADGALPRRASRPASARCSRGGGARAPLRRDRERRRAARPRSPRACASTRGSSPSSSTRWSRTRRARTGCAPIRTRWPRAISRTRSTSTSVDALLAACERALPARAALLPAEARGCSGSTSSSTTTATRRSEMRAARVASATRAASCSTPTATSRPSWRRSPGASSSGAGSTPSSGPASAAAPSPHRPCRASTPTCCSTTPGRLRDVMTLAHELGHGVHQWLAREQGLFEQDTPLTTAETASVFGEMLVFRRLLREESRPEGAARARCAGRSRTPSRRCSARW